MSSAWDKFKEQNAQHNLPQGDPWRWGFCDAVQGRECKSPWAAQGYKKLRSNALYLTGYMAGQDNLKHKKGF